MSDKAFRSVSLSVLSTSLLSLLLFLFTPQSLWSQSILSTQKHQLIGSAIFHTTAPGMAEASAAAAPQPSTEPVLSIDPGGYVLVSSSRLSRTTFRYTYRATVLNSGADAFNVVGTLDVSAPNVQIVSGMVAFGGVPAGRRALSTGTFTVTIDRTTPVTLGALHWTFAYHGPITRELDSNTIATSTISGGGGSITTTSSSGIGFTFDVPKGSLSVPTTISVTPITSYAGIGGLGPLLAAVHLEPSGTLFMPAATLRISGLTFDPTNLSVYAISDDGKSVQLVPFKISGQDLAVSVSHFSDYAVIAQSIVTWKWCIINETYPYWYYESFLTTVTGGGILPDEDRARTVFAVLQQWGQTCNPAHENYITPNFEDTATFFVEEMKRWYNATPWGIAAQLNDATTTANSEPWAINQFWDWMWEAEHDYFFVDMLEFLPNEWVLRPIESDGMNRLASAMQNQLQVGETTCTQNSYTGDTITWEIINKAASFEDMYEGEQGNDWEATIDLSERLFARKNCGGVGLVFDPPQTAVSVFDTFYPSLHFVDRAGNPANSKDAIPLGYQLVPTTVASIDESRLVTAKAPGNATLTAGQQTPDGHVLFDGEMQITVRDLSIDVEPVFLTLQVGETATLTASPKGSGGGTSTCTYQWFSNSIGVVDVAAQGAKGASAVVTAKGVGEALISAVCGDGIGKARVVTYGSITLSPKLGCVSVGRSLQLTVLANGSPVTQSATWSASPKIVSIDGGLMTGLTPGTTTVGATVGTLSDVGTFSVTPVPVCGTWNVVGLDTETSPGTGSWPYTDTYIVAATATPNVYTATKVGYGTITITLVNNSFTFSDITWDSSASAYSCNTNTVTVNNDGTLQGTGTWIEYKNGVCTGDPYMTGISTFTGTLH